MDLPNLFNQAEGEPKKFLSLYLSDKKVQAGLWQVINNQIVFLNHSDLRDFTDEEGCIKETDESLRELGEQSEGVDEVVFGFEPKWLDQGNIADLKKPLLKRLTKELGLRPVGFVVTTEALAQYLAIKEPLLSALAINLTDAEVSVLLIQRGALLGIESVGKSGDMVADVTEALARFIQKHHPEHLPPKMILLSADEEDEELKEQQQALLGFDWTKDHPFLHAPAVEIAPTSTLIEAVTTQGGKAVSQAQGLITTSAGIKTAPAMALKNADQTAADSGFATALTKSEPDLAVEPVASSIASASPVVEYNEAVVSDYADQITAVDDSVTKPKKKFSLPKLWHKKPQFQDELHLPKKKNHHLPYIGVGIAGGILVLAMIMGWWLNSRVQAKVSLTLKSQTVAKEILLTIDPQATAANAAKLILPGSLVSKEVSGNKSTSTTGVKLIGDKAKGQVTIINKTDSEKTLEKGTQLSSGKLKFTLDETAKVASSSVSKSDESETKKYGKTSVAVTAVQIGAESNLAKDTELTVASYSSDTFSAQTEAALSGGSSREVRVVAKQDLTTLKEKLTTELQTQALKELGDEHKQGSYLAPTGKVTASQTKYSDEEGDEVNSITLDLTIKAEAVLYQVQDLKSLSVEVLASQVPSGYELSKKDPQILSTPDTGSKSAVVKLQAQLTAQAIPTFNAEAWKKEIAGQKTSSAVAILKGKKEVSEVRVDILPANVAFLVASLPKESQKIEFEIQD